MKVYRCIKEMSKTSEVFHMGLKILESIKVGGLFIEPDGSGYIPKWGVISTDRKWQSYEWTGGYPKDRELIEDNPEYFEFLIDDTEHDTAYYLKKQYTQFDIDNILKTKP